MSDIDSTFETARSSDVLSTADAGVPEIADDDSHADERLDAVREADGPAALPPDREDGPLALDEFGTTAREQRQGEPLDDRLAREEPDVSDAPTQPSAADVLDDEPVPANLDSVVSTMDRPLRAATDDAPD